MIVVRSRTGDGKTFEFSIEVDGILTDGWLTRELARIRLLELGIPNPDAAVDLAERRGMARCHRPNPSLA